MAAGNGPQGGRRGGWSQSGRPRDQDGRPISGGQRRGGRTFRPGLHDWSALSGGGGQQGRGPGQRGPAGEGRPTERGAPPAQPRDRSGSGGARPLGRSNGTQRPSSSEAGGRREQFQRGEAAQPGRPAPGAMRAERRDGSAGGMSQRPASGPAGFRSRQDPRRGPDESGNARSLSRYGLPEQQGGGRIDRNAPAPYFRAGRTAGVPARGRRPGEGSLTHGPARGSRPYADLDEVAPDGADRWHDTPRDDEPQPRARETQANDSAMARGREGGAGESAPRRSSDRPRTGPKRRPGA